MAPLGALGTLWGHFAITLGRLGPRLGDLGTLQGHFGDLIVADYRFHENRTKVREGCSKTHILEHSLDQPD